MRIQDLDSTGPGADHTVHDREDIRCRFRLLSPHHVEQSLTAAALTGAPEPDFATNDTGFAHGLTGWSLGDSNP